MCRTFVSFIVKPFSHPKLHHLQQEKDRTANMSASEGPFAVGEDGTPRDPAAFRAALLADPQRMAKARDTR